METIEDMNIHKINELVLELGDDVFTDGSNYDIYDHVDMIKTSDLKQSIIKDVEKLIADTEGDHEAYEWFIIEYLNKKFNVDDRDVKINGVYIKCQKN